MFNKEEMMTALLVSKRFVYSGLEPDANNTYVWDLTFRKEYGYDANALGAVL